MSLAFGVGGNFLKNVANMGIKWTYRGQKMAETFSKFQKYRQNCGPDQGPEMILAPNNKKMWRDKDQMKVG